MRKVLILLITVGSIFSCQNGGKNNKMLTQEEAKGLLAQNLRKQIISFNNPLLLDTLNSVYLIPVIQKSLDNTENIEDDSGVLGLMSSRKTSGNYKSMNNLVIYFDKTGIVNQVMRERYLLSNIHYEKNDNDFLITFIGINKDTNSDKELNYKDLSTLFVYSVKQNKLLKIYKKEMHVISYEFVPYTKNLIVLLGHDRDGNGTFDANVEPTYVYRFDFEKEELKPIIDSAQLALIQEILDGKVYNPK